MDMNILLFAVSFSIISVFYKKNLDIFIGMKLLLDKKNHKRRLLQGEPPVLCDRFIGTVLP
jgi:hypothetical protein